MLFKTYETNDTHFKVLFETDRQLKEYTNDIYEEGIGHIFLPYCYHFLNYLNFQTTCSGAGCNTSKNDYDFLW